MSRKGRVSNELVAASCAAVLTVYAAGYWRTREASELMQSQARERRPVRTPTPVATPPAPTEPATVEPAVGETPAADEPLESPPVVAATSPPAPPPKEPAPVAKPVVQDPKPVAKPAPAEQAAKASEPPAVYSVPLDAVPLDEFPDPATTPVPAPGPLPEGFQGWRDGTYTGWGTSNHGDIEATVTIEGGRIVRSGIATCATRYPCDVIYTILYQPVERQSPDVDRVSRATESADAYYYGLVEALKQAEPPADPTPASSN